VAQTITPQEVLLYRIAEPQLGVFHRDQALGTGMSERSVDRGVALGKWKRVHTSVFILSGAPLTWHARLVAACLWAGPLAAASHEAAALLWELPSFTKRPLVVTTTRSVRKRGIIVHNRRLLSPACISRVGAVPVTCPERTLVDIAATQQEAILEASLDDMLIRGLTNLSKIRDYCGRMDEVPGIASLAALIEKRGNVPPNHTILETFSARVVRRFSLPAPHRQVPIYDGAERIKRVDLAYPDFQVLIEPDGARWHQPRRKREEDARVRNRLQSMGWIVLVVTWEAVTEHPRDVAETVLAALRSRGYEGALYENRR
jgi:very-short-patch-repair endonuclease